MASSVGAVAISTETAAGLRMDGDREATLAEHIDHPVVLREDLGFQRPDPCLYAASTRLPTRSEPRPDPWSSSETLTLSSALVAFSRMNCAPPTTCPASLARDREQREVIRISGPDRLGGQVRDVDRRRPEAQSPAFVRESDQVVLDGSLILRPRGSQMHRPTVTEDHVLLEVPRGLRFAHRTRTVSGTQGTCQVADLTRCSAPRVAGSRTPASFPTERRSPASRPGAARDA